LLTRKNFIIEKFGIMLSPQDPSRSHTHELKKY